MTHIARVEWPSSIPTRSRISAAALLVNVIARISPTRARCVWTRYAIRCVSTRVLPEPAPARISSGPSPCSTASRWGGLRPSRRSATRWSAAASDDTRSRIGAPPAAAWRRNCTASPRKDSALLDAPCGCPMTCGRTGAVRGTFDGAAAVRGRGHMRTRRFGRQALVFLAAAAAFSSPAAAAEASCAHASAVPSQLSTRAASHALLCLVNDARRAHGLAPVGYERHLGAAARRHADDMAAHDFFDHVSPRTGTMESRVQHTGYLRRVHALSLGEAIAWGTA